MDAPELVNVRKIALGLPEINERSSHGSPCFFLRDKKPLCYYHQESRGNRRPALWCPAMPGVNREMAETEPERFFEPTPSSSGVFRDWLGVYLDSPVDHEVDWGEVTEILNTAYRKIAPKSLLISANLYIAP